MATGFPPADRVERVMTDRESKFFLSSWDGDVAILKLIDRSHYKMSDIEVLESFRKDLIGFLDDAEDTGRCRDHLGSRAVVEPVDNRTASLDCFSALTSTVPFVPSPMF